MKEWVLIDHDFRRKLPVEDCEIWITRVMYTGDRWVQKVVFYADTQDIDWDGTVAWMIADKGDIKPEPYNEKLITVIQDVR